MADGFITRRGGTMSGGQTNIPKYTYSGNSFVKGYLETSNNSDSALWLTSSGQISFDKNVYADIYLVGGGGGGGYGTSGAGGGGGGYTTLKTNVFIPANKVFDISIGKGGTGAYNTYCQGDPGERTEAFGFYASGGYGGGSSSDCMQTDSKKRVAGGEGGSGGGWGYSGESTNTMGGRGGVNGGIGYTNGLANTFINTTNTTNAVNGQGTSTKAFNEEQGICFSYGGMGGSRAATALTNTSKVSTDAKNAICNYILSSQDTNPSFGSGGRGKGLINGLRNGAASCDLVTESGQDGVVLMRFHKTTSLAPIPFDYDNAFIARYNNNNQWSDIKFLNSGFLTPKTNLSIDAFLVGGGGGGGSYQGGGGAGGYTTTGYNIILHNDQTYSINIGNGGQGATAIEGAKTLAAMSHTHIGQTGQATQAFNMIAYGGDGGTARTGADVGGYGGVGGSGGGRGGVGKTQDATNGYSNGTGSGTEDTSTSKYWQQGQNSSTALFSLTDGELYACGGGGGSPYYNATAYKGAYGRNDNLSGGGMGGFGYVPAISGVNTFGGGGGGGQRSCIGANGGSGTVVIRPTIVNTNESIFNIDDNSTHYYINESTLCFTNNSSFTVNTPVIADVFLVGGGGGGAKGGTGSHGGGGGGGGYTNTIKQIALLPNITYSAEIGQGGEPTQNGQSSQFKIHNSTNYIGVAEGGKAGTENYYGGMGGSGGGFGWRTDYPQGHGSSNGQIGYYSKKDTTTMQTMVESTISIGQMKTTRAFEEEEGQIFSGGGAGSHKTEGVGMALGGLGGGGSTIDKDGKSNSGGGGAGSPNAGTPGKGGSGIVMIKVKENIPDNVFTLIQDDQASALLRFAANVVENSSTDDVIFDDENYPFSDWTIDSSKGIKILSNCYFINNGSNNIYLDMYGAGGGGQGGAGYEKDRSSFGGGGGGGGYVDNKYAQVIEPNTIYQCQIGEGGNNGNSGLGGVTKIIKYARKLSNDNDYYTVWPEEERIVIVKAEGGQPGLGKDDNETTSSSKHGKGGNGGSGGGRAANNNVAKSYMGGTDGHSNIKDGSATNLATDTKDYSANGTSGQISTKPFKIDNALAYCAGGGGGGRRKSSDGVIRESFGGDYGAGQGGYLPKTTGVIKGQDALPNTGSGGGGGFGKNGAGGNGASGCIILKQTNSRILTDSDFEYSGDWEYDQYGIRFKTSGVFKLKNVDIIADLFVVGGGGAGARLTTTDMGSGGSGGGCNCILANPNEDILKLGTEYTFTIGTGGDSSDKTHGGETSITYQETTITKDEDTGEETQVTNTITVLSASGGNTPGGKNRADSTKSYSVTEIMPGGTAIIEGQTIQTGCNGGKGNTSHTTAGTSGEKFQISEDGSIYYNRAFWEADGEIFACGGAAGGAEAVGYGSGTGGLLKGQAGQNALDNTGCGGGGARCISTSSAQLGGAGGSGVILLRVHSKKEIDPN